MNILIFKDKERKEIPPIYKLGNYKLRGRADLTQLPKLLVELKNELDLLALPEFKHQSICPPCSR